MEIENVNIVVKHSIGLSGEHKEQLFEIEKATFGSTYERCPKTIQDFRKRYDQKDLFIIMCILDCYSRTLKNPRKRISFEELPNITLNRPGSTTNLRSWSSKEICSGTSLNLTVFFSPGLSIIFSNPINSITGVETELIVSFIYN